MCRGKTGVTVDRDKNEFSRVVKKKMQERRQEGKRRIKMVHGILFPSLARNPLNFTCPRCQTCRSANFSSNIIGTPTSLPLSLPRHQDFLGAQTSAAPEHARSPTFLGANFPVARTSSVPKHRGRPNFPALKLQNSSFARCALLPDSKCVPRSKRDGEKRVFPWIVPLEQPMWFFFLPEKT